MKLEFTDNLAWLYTGDATKLDDIHDRTIDCVFIDPPYGINYVTGHRKVSLHSAVRTNERFKEIANDKEFPTKMLVDCLWELYRVMKPESAIYVCTRWDVQNQVMALMEDLFQIRNCITWVKNNWTAGDLEGNYGYQTEMIIYATKGDHKLLGKRGTNAWFFKRVEGKQLLHPAQKPVPLVQYAISKSCPEGGVVLDCFAGSCSTVVAAHQMGRYSVGVDLDPENIKIGIGRLQTVELITEDVSMPEQSNFQPSFI
jgi:site-specific DNA-methyltransferase (adenine-specific)